MDFDSHEKKPLLYADLFKSHNNYVPQSKQQTNSIVMSADSELISNSSSTISIHSSAFDSSSSGGFSTPFGSELGSSESEDGEYFDQLTRQMTECMLQEEEEEEEEEEIHEKKQNSIPNYSVLCEDFKSKQLKQLYKTDQSYMQYRATGHGGKGQNGSGMQVIFLGGSGSRNGSNTGTGVFFPRVKNDPAELKEKPGCSTVLIPTRVLQVLKLHFNKRSDSSAPPFSGGPASRSESLNHKDGLTRPNGQRNIQSQFRNGTTNHVEEMQLPQEWTY